MKQVWSKRRLGNPRGLGIGDAVTRRGEPEVAGVILQFEPNVYGESEGWAWIETRRGVLRIPTHTLRLRRRSARDTHRFTAAARSGRAHALHRLAKRGGSHTYATPEVKRTASYKRAERLEDAIAPRRWLTPGLTRSQYEKLADAWERAGFMGWADNYRAHVEHHKIGRDPGKRIFLVHYYDIDGEKRHREVKAASEKAAASKLKAEFKRSGEGVRVFDVEPTYASRDPGKRHHHRTPGAPSFAKQNLISRKIRLLVREGYDRRQAAAIAYRMYGASRKA